MKKHAFLVLFIIISSGLIGICGCQVSTKNKETRAVSTTSSENTDDCSESVGTTKHAPTREGESSCKSVPDVSVKTSDSKEPKDGAPDSLQQKTVVEMEKSFLQTCELNGIVLKITEDNNSRIYRCDNYMIALTRFADEKSAEKSYNEMINYGGWYEEDQVIKEIQIDEDGLTLLAYYCQEDGGEKQLFVLAHKENLFFSLEGWDNEQVQIIEDLLREMGIAISC